MPLRRYSCSRRDGLRGRACDVGPGRRLGLDAGLLVDRDDQRPRGRIEVEPAYLRGLRVEVGAELAHHPLLEQVRLDLGRAQDLVRLRLRHPDLLGQLAMRPALAPQSLRGLARTRTGERDQSRPHLRAVHERPPRPGRIAQPSKTGRLETATPLLHRLLRAADLARDPRGRAPSSSREHDPRPLDRPPLRRTRAHEPLQLAPILDADLDPFRRCSHTDRLHRRPTGRRPLRSTTTGPCYWKRTNRSDH